MFLIWHFFQFYSLLIKKKVYRDFYFLSVTKKHPCFNCFSSFIGKNSQLLHMKLAFSIISSIRTVLGCLFIYLHTFLGQLFKIYIFFENFIAKLMVHQHFTTKQIFCLVHSWIKSIDTDLFNISNLSYISWPPNESRKDSHNVKDNSVFKWPNFYVN